MRAQRPTTSFSVFPEKIKARDWFPSSNPPSIPPARDCISIFSLCAVSEGPRGLRNYCLSTERARNGFGTLAALFRPYRGINRFCARNKIHTHRERERDRQTGAENVLRRLGFPSCLPSSRSSQRISEIRDPALVSGCDELAAPRNNSARKRSRARLRSGKDLPLKFIPSPLPLSLKTPPRDSRFSKARKRKDFSFES